MAESSLTGIKCEGLPMRGGRLSGRHPGGSIGSSSLTVLASQTTPNHGAHMTRLLTALFLTLVMACTGDKAKDLLETAEFEERQMNIHAKQLYEEVIRLYPSSQEAEKARARLAKLSQT